MQRKQRWALVAALCLLLALLTACNPDLDAKRNRFGLTNANGDVEFNGAVYKKLENIRRSERFSPCYDDSARRVYIASDDRPLLLCNEVTCNEFVLDGTGVILENYHSKDTVNSEFYCREDRYDTVLQWITEGNAEYTHYGYTLDEEAELNPNAETIHLGTPALTDVIDRVRATVTPRMGDVNLIRGECLYLLKSTEDMLFVEHAAMAITENNGTYVLVDYNGEEAEYSYTVPAADSGPIKELYDQWLASGMISLEYTGSYY